MKRKDCTSPGFQLSFEYLDWGLVKEEPVCAKRAENLYAVRALRGPCKATLTHAQVSRQDFCEQHHEDYRRRGPRLQLVRHLLVDTGLAMFDAPRTLARFESLVSLSLTPGPLAARVVDEVELGRVLPSLQGLFVPFCDVDVYGIAVGLPKLRFLDLCGNPKSDLDLSHAIGVFKELEGLDLSLSRAGPLTMEAVAKLAQGSGDWLGFEKQNRDDETTLLDLALHSRPQEEQDSPRGLRVLYVTLSSRCGVGELRDCSTLGEICVRNSTLSAQECLELVSLRSVSLLRFEQCCIPPGFSFSRRPLEVQIRDPIDYH